MAIARRFSLRSVFLSVSVTALLCALACRWVSYPQRTAESLVEAIRAKDIAQVEYVLGDQAVDDEFRRLVTRGRYDANDVFARFDDRAFAAILNGRQSVVIAGYGGAHRFTVVRGAITDLRYTFISGGFEYRR